jgi:large subunit ribosomal protein L6
MSRVGKLAVKVPDSIKIVVNDNKITFDNGKLKNEYQVSKGVQITFEDKEIKVSAINKNQSKISMFVGMDRSNINNIVKGMSEGFKTILEINGVGFKAAVVKNLLVLDLGFSHEIVYTLPKEISASFEKPNLITLSGSDKVLVGQIAAEIISFRKPEPYKGKGVRKQGQFVLRKEGKKK